MAKWFFIIFIGLLAFAMNAAVIGHFGLARGICMFPKSQLSAWASENDACSVLSLLSIGIGVFVLWPSAKLLQGLMRIKG